jgi:hypothetical protein
MQIDMNIDAQPIDPIVFRLTGKQPGRGSEALAGKQPALLAAYRDLTRLRYDFPVVLIEGRTHGAPVRSLSGVVDDLLGKIAPPGIESEELRKMVLRIEREIRTLAAADETGPLSALWNTVAMRLEEADESLGKSVRIARAALEVDGAVLDCGPGLAGRLIAHLWSAVQVSKAQRFRAALSRLTLKLADILRADYLRSPAGRSAESLSAAFGPAHQMLFDFAAMSKLLPKSSSRDALSEERRRRIESALAVLKRQRFFAPASGQARPDPSVEPHSFHFGSCDDAIAAYRARLPELVELVKAMAIAELEIDGTYREAHHDAVFASFDAGSLNARDSATFPDYLVTVGAAGQKVDNSAVIAALCSEAPLKIVVTIDDLLEEGGIGDGHGAAGLRNAQLAGLAAGLGEVFVVQSASSNLYQLRERIHRGLAFAGPALFSVFSGVPVQEGTLPPYLSAAVAMQSRAFPTFSYDPSAGSDMATRFSLENNPQQDADWTVQPLEYAGSDMQRIRQETPFTFVDFLLCDPRHQHHFIAAPRGFEPGRMVTAAQWIAGPSSELSDRVPYVLAADGEHVLSRVIVGDRAITAARRCLENWHRLQEFGGVHNSHAARLVKHAKEIWEEQKRQEMASLKPAAAPAAAASGATAPIALTATPAPAPEAAAERDPDEAYIETERCSTCNECTLINDRMFAYSANKQAYIADITAGTYAQLVQAAESCQLAIIHPGKPINSNEPGLDELIERAQPFL